MQPLQTSKGDGQALGSGGITCYHLIIVDKTLKSHVSTQDSLGSAYEPCRGGPAGS